MHQVLVEPRVELPRKAAHIQSIGMCGKRGSESSERSAAQRADINLTIARNLTALGRSLLICQVAARF